ncbi:hypothetical protein [Streptomyces lunaelactis]|uniref:hypothetical protein n=1 Tax=Streptomyces lunaelactis TaxID=1535768 RepID=UPI0026BA8F52|nr:hypothetical protein [Streptomyces lunaelactis]
MREVRRRGISPKSDKELLPLLLEVIGNNIPVERWPTQLSKAERTAHAREVAQAGAAAADRPASALAVHAPRLPVATTTGADGNVVPLRWCDRATQGQNALDHERRRRREAVVPERPTAPPGLDEQLRASSLMVLPDDDLDENDIDDTAAVAEGEIDL